MNLSNVAKAVELKAQLDTIIAEIDGIHATQARLEQLLARQDFILAQLRAFGLDTES